MDKPFQFGRRARWAAACLLASAGAALAEPRDVEFSVLLPEAEQVHLVGSFTDWEIVDDMRMENDHGRWTKTLSLDEGTHSYAFKAAGAKIADDGWRLDWKALREAKRPRGRACSAVVVPDDLEVFHARQQAATETEDGGIVVPLFYDRSKDANSPYRYYGTTFHSLESERPAGDWTLPEPKDEQTMYGTVQLGDSEFLAIVDRQSTNDAFYNRVLLDRNGNRDLTDDQPLLGKAQMRGREDYFDYSFPWIDLDIESGGRRLPYSIGLRVSGAMPPRDGDETSGRYGMRMPNLGVSPNCAYLGEFAVDGVGFRMALYDGTANGTFDDRASSPDNVRYGDRSLYARGDVLTVTTTDRVARASGSLLGSFLAIGDRLFRVRVDVPNGQMVLSPLSGPEVGTLELPGPMRSLTLLSARNDDAWMAILAGDRVSVPAGRWRLLNYQLVKKDEWGDEWSLQGRGTEETPVVSVPPTGSVRLAVGEPLQAVVAAHDMYLRQAAAKGSLRISLSLLGNLKETISDVSRISGTNTQHQLAKRYSNRPEEATYRIVKPDGERIASGSFEYG